jgi:hypothetical protein
MDELKSRTELLGFRLGAAWDASIVAGDASGAAE